METVDIILKNPQIFSSEMHGCLTLLDRLKPFKASVIIGPRVVEVWNYLVERRVVSCVELLSLSVKERGEVVLLHIVCLLLEEW